LPAGDNRIQCFPQVVCRTLGQTQTELTRQPLFDQARRRSETGDDLFAPTRQFNRDPRKNIGGQSRKARSLRSINSHRS